MTASLYHRASLGSMPDRAAGSSAGAFSDAGDLESFIYLRRSFDASCMRRSITGRMFNSSQVIVEVLLAAHPPPQPEHMRGHALRVEHDVVIPAAPDVALLAQQIMHLVGLLGIEFQRAHIHVHPPGLRLMRVEVHHRQ